MLCSLPTNIMVLLMMQYIINKQDTPTFTVKNRMCANMIPTFGAVVTPKWCQCNTMGATVTP